MKLASIKKSQTLIIPIILLSVVFNFAAAPIALALTEPNAPGSPGIMASTIGKWALQGFGAIGSVLVQLISLFTLLSGGIFDMALSYNKDFGTYGLEPVKAGWTITRDIANMFFIIILLIIAIATILRISAYQAKALLPRLIIIALLINFSLTIGFVVIDFSNALALQFYNKLRPNGISVSALIIQGTKIQETYNAGGPLQVSQQELTKSNSVLGTIVAKAVGVGGSIGTGFLIGGPVGAVIGTLGSLWSILSGLGEGSFEQASLMAVITYGNLILLSIMVIVFLVGAILLLVRVVILGFLLILSPLAFLFYILPDTQDNWKKWWHSFMSHAFFFPAFLFLLYIAMKFILDMSKGLTNVPALDSSPLLFSYILATVMILAALILGRSMGVYGASTAMSWASTGRKWLTGAVGGIAGRNIVAPIGARLQQSERLNRLTLGSPTLRNYTQQATGWLANRGDAKKQAEDMAKDALGQAKSNWGASFSKLNILGKEAMLRQMTPEQRAAFLATLPESQRAIANSIMRSPQFAASETAKVDLESWKRMTNAEKIAEFDGLNDDAKEQILRSMSDDEKAKFVDSLAGTPAQALAENIINTRLSPKERQDVHLARVALRSEDEQRLAFATEFNNDEREAFLRKKGDKAAEFIAGFRKPTSPTSTVPYLPASMADEAENLIKNRFSAPERYQYQKTKRQQWIKDAKGNLGNKFLTETVADQEEIFDAASDREKAEIAYEMRKAGKTSEIKSIIDKKLASVEALEKFRKANAKFISEKSATDIAEAADKMEDEELNYLVQDGDADKIANVITSRANAGKTSKLGKLINDLGIGKKYENKMSPKIYVENIKSAPRIDTATKKISDTYKDELRKHFETADIKALKNITSPDMLKQKEFVEDLIIAGTMEDIALIAGDARRAAAFKEGLESIIGKKATSKEAAEALADQMKTQSNQAGEQELRDYLAGTSPYKDVITSILEGKAQPLGRP